MVVERWGKDFHMWNYVIAENVSILAVKNPVNITALESKQTVNVTDTEKQSFPLKDENSKDTANPNKENDLQERYWTSLFSGFSISSQNSLLPVRLPN